MFAQIKVARLLGAVLVMLALVPWLGISPAAATGGDNGKGAAQGPDNGKADNGKADNGKADNGKADNGKADNGKADKGEKSAGGKSAGEKEADTANTSAAGEKAATSARSDDDKAAGKGDSSKAEKGSAKKSGSGNQKVTLCHRTNSESNPYVRITVSINSVIKSSGHDSHNGAVHAAGMKAAHQKWGDIIPAFSYDAGSYAGQNWAGGATIYGAGCASEPGGGQTTPPPTITATATPSGGGGSTSQKVTLCHRTNSETNPYVRITVSINSVVKGRGHDGHNGPVFAAGMKSAHEKWGDIIPSFTYPGPSSSTASYGGKNWPAGQAIFDAGCTVGQPTSTTTVSPSETTSVSPSGTTSVSPSGTQTVTTTVTGPNGTVTVTQTVTPGTSVLPTKIGNGDTGVLGGRTGVLPRTGLDLPLGAALGLSFLLLLAGGTLMVVPSRVNTESNRRH